MSSPPVVIRFGAFGDMVLLLPLIRDLAAHHGRAIDVVSSGGWTRPLLEPQSCVGELRLLSSRNAPYLINRGQRELVAWLRDRQQVPVYLCETDKKSRWLVEQAGLGACLHWAGDEPMRPDEHWLRRWHRLGRKWTGRNHAPGELEAQLKAHWLDVPAAAEDGLQAWLESRGWANSPLLLLQPGSKRTMRRGAVDRDSNIKFWPVDRWAAAARHWLQRNPAHQILICGSPEEAGFTADVAECIGDPRVTSVADDLPIPRLLALLKRAQGMLSVDTGPAHAAAALGCPLVVLFGDADPARWQPWSVSGDVHIVNARGPLRGLPLNFVTEALDQLALRS